MVNVPFNSLVVFHFLFFFFFWFVWQFIALYSSTLSHIHTILLSHSHAHSHSRSFTYLLVRNLCLLSLPEMLLSHCNTLIYKDLFFFSASINMLNRIAITKNNIWTGWIVIGWRAYKNVHTTTRSNILKLFGNF